MSRLFRLAAALFAVSLLLGNTNCTKNNASDAPQFVTSLAVENTSNQPVSAFAQHEPVQLVLTVRNRSGSAQKLFFNTSEMVNFAVVNAGTADVVWTCDGTSTSCTPASGNPAGSDAGSGFTELDFAAGETKTFTFTWDQTDNSGVQLGTGSYEVLGGLTVFNTTGPSDAANDGDSMTQGPPDAKQLDPSAFRSVLVPFSIQ